MSPAGGRASVRTSVLVLCTANVCRSPMAAAILSSRLHGLAAGARVTSAGLLPGCRPADPIAVRVMAGIGLDISAHRSRQVAAADVAAADLVLAIARDSLQHAIVLEPSAWPRAFTLKEIVRRAGQADRRPAGQPLADWVAGLHEGRKRVAMLGTCPEDDVADPSGGSLPGYGRTAAVLSRLVDGLVACGWDGTRPTRSGW
jgi:protein-tyrosine phosphatase